MLRPKSELVIRAIPDGVETSISEMLPAFTDSDKNSLENIASLAGELKDLGLNCVPPLTQGTSSDKRILRPILDQEIDQNELRKKLLSPEDDNMELKSSLLFNFNQANAQPELSPAELNHETQVHGVLKTICAFANSDGGELYVGVEDSGAIIGLQFDFGCIGGIEDCDTWLTFLKSIIKTNFYSGSSILIYIDFKILEIDDEQICKIKVVSTVDTQFIRERRKSTRYKCYFRSSNGTEEIPIQDLPSFIESRHSSVKF